MRGPLLQPIFQPIMRPIVRAVLGASRGGRYNGPSLALRFGENQYLMGAIGKKPDVYQPEGLITFARSTAAWEWDWQGNYSEVAAGVMRIAHDPLTKSTSTTPQTLGTGSYTFAVTYQYPIGKAVRVSADAANWMVGRVTASSPTSVTILVSSPPTGAGTYSAWTLIVRRGIRVEEQRTNLAVQSGDFTSASWAKSVGGGLAVTPLAKGQRIDFAATLDFISQATQSVAANTKHTVFVIAARNSGKAVLRLTTAASTHLIRATIDTAARTLTFKNVTGTGVFVGATVTSFEDGWDIYALTGEFTAAQTGVGLMLVRELSAETTITVLGAQFEAAPAPSSHIPTGASQVIRAADVPVVNTLAPWFNPLEGLLVARVIRESISPSQTLVALSGTSISTISLESGAGNPAQLRMRVSVDGVQVAIPIAANSSAAYTPIKMAAAYKKDFFSVSANGAPPAEDTSGTVPVVTRLEIGSVNNAARLNGIIESITYHPRVTDTQQASA